jgi:hypothetical protein
VPHGGDSAPPPPADSFEDMALIPGKGPTMKRAIRSLVAGTVAVVALGAAVAFAAYVPARAVRSGARATVTPPSKSSDSLVPGWLCRAQRDAMGVSAFNQLWGGKPKARHAMGRCVAGMAKAKSHGTAVQVEKRVLAAVQTCMSDLRRRPASFHGRFGATSKRSNALGKCIHSRSGVGAGSRR